MGMRESARTGAEGSPPALGVASAAHPRWMLAGQLVLVAGLALAAVPHRPSTEQRAADLRGMVRT